MKPIIYNNYHCICISKCYIDMYSVNILNFACGIWIDIDIWGSKVQQGCSIRKGAHDKRNYRRCSTKLQSSFRSGARLD